MSDDAPSDFVQGLLFWVLVGWPLISWLLARGMQAVTGRRYVLWIAWPVFFFLPFTDSLLGKLVEDSLARERAGLHVLGQLVVSGYQRSPLELKTRLAGSEVEWFAAYRMPLGFEYVELEAAHTDEALVGIENLVPRPVMAPRGASTAAPLEARGYFFQFRVAPSDDQENCRAGSVAPNGATRVFLDRAYRRGFDLSLTVPTCYLVTMTRTPVSPAVFEFGHQTQPQLVTIKSLGPLGGLLDVRETCDFVYQHRPRRELGRNCRVMQYPWTYRQGLPSFGFDFGPEPSPVDAATLIPANPTQQVPGASR